MVIQNKHSYFVLPLAGVCYQDVIVQRQDGLQSGKSHFTTITKLV